MNVNVSNECFFSEVHGAMNRSGSLAKFTRVPIYFARDPLRFIAP